MAAELAARLDDPDPAVRRSAVEGIGQLRVKDSVAPLCRALADADIEVRRAAANWLGNFGDRFAADVVGPLRTALADPDASVRIVVLDAVRRLGRSGAALVPDVIPRLRDGEVAFAAASALGAIGTESPEAADALLAVLDGPAGECAAGALGYFPHLPASAEGPLLAYHARTAEGTWRHRAVLPALGRLPDATPAVLSALRRGLGDEAMSARVRAAEALAAYGPSAASAVPDLVAAVQAGHREVACHLPRFGPAGVDALLDLLDSPHGRGCEGNDVLFALREAGPVVVPILPRLRADLPRCAHFKLALVSAAIGATAPADPSVIPDLLNVLRRGDWMSYPDGLVEPLSSFGPALVPFVPELTALLADRGTGVGLGAVVRVLRAAVDHGAADGVVGPLRELLRTYHPRWVADPVPQLAADILARLGTGAAAAVPELTALLDDDRPERRVAAVQALAEVAPAAAREALGRATHDKDDGVRAAAVAALGRCGSKEAIPDLLDALSDRAARVRRETADALGRLGHATADVLAALRRAEADDADKGVRARAGVAARRLNGGRRRR